MLIFNSKKKKTGTWFRDSICVAYVRYWVNPPQNTYTLRHTQTHTHTDNAFKMKSTPTLGFRSANTIYLAKLKASL